MGKLEQGDSRGEGGWMVAPDVEQLRVATEAWLSGAAKDGPSNRLFLDLFAVYLVKHCRAEEARLAKMKDPGLAWHRGEHRRLVRQVWALMSDELLGLDLATGLRDLVEAWALHRISASQRPDVRPSLGH